MSLGGTATGVSPCSTADSTLTTQIKDIKQHTGNVQSTVNGALASGEAQIIEDYG
jgi:hypothetical protein